MLVELLGALIVLGLVAYAVLGGADFGGGVWDLLARGARAKEQRAAIADAMGPVWEANHVWLIFVIVLLFTAFPSAFALLSVMLFVPLHLVLLGIILRGAAFVFRAYGPRTGATERRFGGVFGVASLLTPLVLGMCLGAVTSGRVRRTAEGVALPSWPAWLAPESLAVGALAVAVCALLAATFLVVETRGALREDFRRRALVACASTVVLGALALAALAWASPRLRSEFVAPAGLAFFVAGAVAAGLAAWALWVRRDRTARFAVISLATLMLSGWALFQHPFLVYPVLRVDEAAAPTVVLETTLVIVVVGMFVLVPSLWALFHVFKRTPTA